MLDPAISLVARPLGVMALAFGGVFLLMPALIRALRAAGMGKNIRDLASAPVMATLHKNKAGMPTMGGIAMWGVVILLAFLFAEGCQMAGEGSFWCHVSFLSRGQTWLPLGLMFAAALVGLVDDYWNVRRLGPKGGGLRKRHRILSYTLIAVVGAWWFYTKLGWDQLHIPFIGTYNLGWWYVPFFILTVTATSLSVNETDGLDGLAGGGMLAAFGAYAVRALSQARREAVKAAHKTFIDGMKAAGATAADVSAASTEVSSEVDGI
jgi:phospho-N-acetylmuramoyl-pentapeptide-transferase